MSDNMVERVANAIEAELPRTPEFKAVNWTVVARAALEAIRDPTQRMIDAGTFCAVVGALDCPVSKIVWQAMCDIALGVPTIAEAKREGKHELKVQ